MSINQVTDGSARCKPAIRFLGVVDRAALTVLYVMVMAVLPMTAIGLMI
jgi:hypothetical protein